MDTTCIREVKRLISLYLVLPIFIVSTIHFQELHSKYEKGMIRKNLELLVFLFVCFYTNEMGRESMRCFLQERGEEV